MKVLRKAWAILEDGRVASEAYEEGEKLNIYTRKKEAKDDAYENDKIVRVAIVLIPEHGK